MSQADHARQKLFLPGLFSLLIAKIVLHLPAISAYGFQRDELLYMAQGQNPGWGYWSTPPLTSWISALSQFLFGQEIWSIRIIPLLVGMAILYLAMLMAKEMGAGRFGQTLTGASILVAPAILRTSSMLQPVIFDIFFWTLLCYSILRYLKEEKDQWIYLFGAVLGLSLLNKYMTIFLVIALLPALLVGGRIALFRKRSFWLAIALAILIFSPNLIWQWQNDWPVFMHFSRLSSSQLVNVSPASFLLDQLVLFAPILLIWIGGLAFLVTKKAKTFRVLAWLYIAVIIVFLVLKGKSYYTIGIYPVLLAAGGTAWEIWLKPKWAKWSLAVLVLASGLSTLPISLPILKIPAMINYGNQIKGILEGPWRWEDGQVYDIPQDYADMFGWEELGQLVDQAIVQLATPDRLLIYAENYGQAGAINRYSTAAKDLEVASFSDAFLHWAPEKVDVEALIYVNDELGDDVAALFNDIQIIGTIENPLAREQGTTVYLCQDPQSPFNDLWQAAWARVRGQ